MKLLTMNSPRLLLLPLMIVTLGGNTTAHADSRVNVHIGVPLPRGYAEVSVGRDRYHYHRGTFYGHGRHGYHVVRAPRGCVVRDLHPRHTSILIGGSLYYRYNNVYYQSCPGGYVVVDPPRTTVVKVAAPAAQSASDDTRENKDSEYQSAWVGDVEYLFKDGQFFKRTSEGLVWSEAPLGAITKVLPDDARTIWYEEIEFFECDDVCFRKTPDGYKVVVAPWKKAEAASADGK